MLTTLLVEDQDSFRRMVRDDLLSRFSAIKVIEASDGEEAIKELESNPVDLIFMDISMPGQSGLLLTKEIGALNPSISIVMLSGYDFEEYRKAAFQSGASGFMSKDSADLGGQMSTIVNCFQGAKAAGRLKPGCFFVSEGNVSPAIYSRSGNSRESCDNIFLP